MDSLNFVNLIQAATVGISILGGLLLWRQSPFVEVALLLGLIAFASTVNILEETGITRDIYLLSPIFIMLFGPASYLAAKHITNKTLQTSDWMHLLPVAPVLFFTSHVAVVIVIGSIWRVVYAYFTAILLMKHKVALDEKRSDSDDFSFTWLVWVLVITAFFNLLDLARLNSQQFLPYELNLIGQAMNNMVWLVAATIITIKLIDQKALTTPHKVTLNNVHSEAKSEPENYGSTFNELDKLVINNEWFLTPRLTLSDVSELSGLQPRDISRAINTVANKSFNEYINEYRIHHICSALDAQSPHSLSRLYTDAGFSSKASFNKLFKEYTGKTPSEYKAQIKSA
ncbi:helix-turn-helix domain-containing protein [Alteromonas sp. A079]|uniref:helix-turn-helix domain-containing protein n=1 Tax=Alteromonas sp. A079 TaxID=3410268 RepID=UPI003B9F2356